MSPHMSTVGGSDSTDPGPDGSTWSVGTGETRRERPLRGQLLRPTRLVQYEGSVGHKGPGKVPSGSVLPP